jgi:serine/threonine-protein kinase HipA
MLSTEIEIFQHGRWIRAAEFRHRAPSLSESDPYRATFEYALDYAFGDAPQAVSLEWPVTAEYQGLDREGNVPPCPAFLLDYVPQGPGRQRLLAELGLTESDRHDLTLAQYGAYNPIGNLRFSTAVAFHAKRLGARGAEAATRGFTLADMQARKDSFLEHIWLHAMLTAGTTGLQGAAPKFLLTQDKQGLWHADAALPDTSAVSHWLVKLPRGSHSSDFRVLKNEAAYLRVAALCGLRVAGAPQWRDDMLFLPRFDRRVDTARTAPVLRLHQESMASLTGSLGFGQPVSLFRMAAAIVRHATRPLPELVEFAKRDILNLALRNTDNHARNAAMQRLPDGTVQLTPVFDFAPMYLDREFVVRSCRWHQGLGSGVAEMTDWREIAAHLPINAAAQSDWLAGLSSFAHTVRALPALMREAGVESAIIDDCAESIATQVARLEAIA